MRIVDWNHRETRHAGHCCRSRDELISDVLLWTPTHGRAKVGRRARTYIQQLCEDTGCSPEDLPEAMNDREGQGYLWYQHDMVMMMTLLVFLQQCPACLVQLISDVLLWTPTHGRAKVGRRARTYIQQLCEDTGCSPEDLPEAMNDREEWRERVRDIRGTSTTWWWWWHY